MWCMMWLSSILTHWIQKMGRKMMKKRVNTTIANIPVTNTAQLIFWHTTWRNATSQCYEFKRICIQVFVVVFVTIKTFPLRSETKIIQPENRNKYNTNNAKIKQNRISVDRIMWYQLIAQQCQTKYKTNKTTTATAAIEIIT